MLRQGLGLKQAPVVSLLTYVLCVRTRIALWVSSLRLEPVGKGRTHVGPPEGLCFHPLSPKASETLGLRVGVLGQGLPSLQPGCSVPGLPRPVNTEPPTVLLSSVGLTRIFPVYFPWGLQGQIGWLPTAPALPEQSGWMPFTGGCSTSLLCLLCIPSRRAL